MTSRIHDVAIIGGGIVGLATARALLRRWRLSLLVLEAEKRVGSHQTGHNSGVVHSGLYYRPGSLKSRLCVSGREALYRFCEASNIPFERCGKVVVAIHPAQLPALGELEQRGLANGLAGLRRLGPEELREHEPFVRGLAGLLVPETGIVDFSMVAEEMARQIQEDGGELLTGNRVTGISRHQGSFVLQTPSGAVQCRHLISCAGLQADRIARLCGLRSRIRIVPFRGEYFALRPDCHHLVRNLIYPVPDPRFPFLGVHFTRMIHGGIEAGPNAVLAFKREGYARTSFSVQDSLDCLTYAGFYRMAAHYWRTGIAEWYRSLHKPALVRDLQRLIPQLQSRDLVRHSVGVRAQAISPQGAILDDFVIEEGKAMLHVLNAPSPAATASLSIGETLADRAAQAFDLPVRPRPKKA